MPVGAANRRRVEVCIGKAGLQLGSLVHVKHGRRENCAFAYDEAWLASPERFGVSADLPLVAGYQAHKATSSTESVFHGAFADTMPDAWGRRVIARDHAKRRVKGAHLPALTELDYLLAVDDFSRVGALRLRDADVQWQRSVEQGRRNTPPLIELARIYEASRAVERGQETREDLRYLQGKGTSLGGMRPKCTIVDDDGSLAIGKFPSVTDVRSVTRGEALAMRLASKAGVEVAAARIVVLDDVPVLVVRRFDRDASQGRIPYQSAASLLQVSREEDSSYTQIADAIRAASHAPTRDLRELWRRMVFNLLITNVDDHLQNHGFLHVEHGLWRLAPAFDINPFPDKERESKTWLSEQDGPIVDLHMLLGRASAFALRDDEALAVLAQVHAAVAGWRQIALGPEVGMQAVELDEFAPAFEHAQQEQAARQL
jgi:serine/threonine-protein kinase HipA